VESDDAPENAVRLIAGILIGAGIAALVILLGRRRRPGRDPAEPGEEIGHPPEEPTVAAPEAVEVGGEIPERTAEDREGDLSDRRQLPPGPYRPSLDVPETVPAEAAPEEAPEP